MSRVVLLVTTPRVAPGLLSDDAWNALRSGPVLTRDADDEVLDALARAGIEVSFVDRNQARSADADDLREAAAAGCATWLTGPGDERLVELLEDVDVEVLHGSWDLPGARLLDVVATVDRLRSPGGCPWDAKQTHESLASYLLEEAYEAFQAIEDGDLDGIREEFGDVLYQAVFHARLAEELPEDERWSIDDLAGGLVDKLIRRHPHVFADVDATTAEEVNANWEAIKSAERGEVSPLASVPMSAPALTLANTLQRKALRAGMDAVDVSPELTSASSPAAAVTAAVEHLDTERSVDAAGALLWNIVAMLRSMDIDPEAALRGRARQFRDAQDDAWA